MTTIVQVSGKDYADDLLSLCARCRPKHWFYSSRRRHTAYWRDWSSGVCSSDLALGFSRDDVESKFVPVYLERRINDKSPFETIDRPGVGWLVRLAAWVGREAKPDLKLGICGEHGGDPDSVAFFHSAGLDYVSCSPYRVPIARVAAAQAAISAE